jgi:hypothetical protein
MNYWHDDLTQIAGGVPAPNYTFPTSYLTVTASEGAVRRILYFNDYGYGGDIHEIRNSGGTWMPDADLSLLLSNYSGDFQGYCGAFPYVAPWDGYPRVPFLGLDLWTYEFKLDSNGWTVTNLSQLAGYELPPSGYVWQPISPPFPYIAPDNITRLIYIATLNWNSFHVHELIYDPSDPTPEWEYNDLNSLAIAGGWDAPDVNGAPFGYISRDNAARVVYIDFNNNVQELRLENFQTSNWICANLSSPSLGNAPPASGANPTAYVPPDTIGRVLFVGADQHGHELSLASSQSPWVHTDLTQRSSALTNVNSMLWGYYDGVPRAVYVGTDTHIHQFSNEFGGWSDQDIFANVVNLPATAMAATGYWWSSPYVYESDGMWFILYVGTDQHVHLLTPIGDEEQRRPLSMVAAAKLRRALAARRRR